MLELDPESDRSLIIRYFGQDLALAAVRIEVPGWTGNVDGFLDDVRAWLAADGEDDLLWALSMQVEVVQVS